VLLDSRKIIPRRPLPLPSVALGLLLVLVLVFVLDKTE
jgi:hypothetical protein